MQGLSPLLLVGQSPSCLIEGLHSVINFGLPTAQAQELVPPQVADDVVETAPQLSPMLSTVVCRLFAQFDSGTGHCDSLVFGEVGDALQAVDSALGQVLEAQPAHQDWPTALRSYCAAVMLLHQSVEQVLGPNSPHQMTRTDFSRFIQTFLASTFDVLCLPEGHITSAVLKHVAGIFGLHVVGANLSRAAFVEVCRARSC